MTNEAAAASANEVQIEDTYLCRIATILLNAGKSENARDFLQPVRSALESDTRVTYARFNDPQNPDFIDYEIYYSDRAQATTKSSPQGSGAFNAISFDQLLFFKIVVPIKNQPKHHDADDIPTDTYWVAWNGLTAFILWKHEGDLVPLSGGHVVLEILQDAAERCGLSVYNQACSPGCTNVFLHTTLVVSKEEDQEEFEVIDADGNHISVAVPDLPDEEDVLYEIAYHLGYAAEHFSRRKNISRKLANLESLTTEQLQSLLVDYSGHAETAAKPFRGNLKEKWGDRSWRKHARLHSARVWLGASTMESFIHDWHEQDAEFQQELSPGFAAIFAGDSRRDGVTVSSINISRLTEICAQVEKRFDTAVLSWATAGGAIAGAIAGSLVTLFH
jgi:hypothetical protein